MFIKSYLLTLIFIFYSCTFWNETKFWILLVYVVTKKKKLKKVIAFIFLISNSTSLYRLFLKVDDSSVSDKKVLMKELEEKIQEITLEISSLFEDNEIERVKETVIRLKYYTNISERVRELIPPE